MNALLPGDIINYIVSDITACVFLIVLIIAIAFQTSKHKGLPHLLAAALLILAGILVRTSAGMMSLLPEGLEWNTGAHILPPTLSISLWVISYALTTIGITESVTHVIYMNEDDNKSGLKARYAVCVVLTAAGSVLFCFNENTNFLSVFVLALFGYFWLSLRKNWSERTQREFIRSSVVPVVTFALALASDQVRLTGLGLSVMLTIMAVQYNMHIRRDLAEKEAALANSRLQILTSQISPHYIFNSLQGISGLCGTDSDKAGEAIDAFSGYLRGNLESLTTEELIPFTRELEHTKAYLELEHLSGLRRFVAEYDLGVTDFMVPPLVLQPVVENAVQHGTAKATADPETGEAGLTTITISTHESGGLIYIEVTDRTEVHEEAAEAGSETAREGAAIDARRKAPEIAQNRKHRSVGLDNVRTRLALQAGGAFELESSSEGTKAVLILPKTALPTKSRKHNI